jgi:hypothetical protein
MENAKMASNFDLVACTVAGLLFGLLGTDL